jgi:pyruvate dehydrogenase E2 component (dihydrolipoamide acetyltransferase)
MAEFRMPALGADMEQGTLVEWLVERGDFVHRGDLVAAVETDKSVIDIETFEEGVVAELLAEVGDVLPVGAPLARITPTPASAGETERSKVVKPRPARAGLSPSPAQSTRPLASPPVRQFAQRVGVDTTTIRGTGRDGAITHADVERAAGLPIPVRQPAAPGRTRSSPRARKLAAERGIDLATVVGSGPQGAVREDDLHGAVKGEPDRAQTLPPPPVAEPPRAAAQQPADALAAAKRAAGLRRAIGSLMARSKKTIPHYYLSTTIDMSAALTWTEKANAGRPLTKRLVPAALLLKATALAAREVPEMNGYCIDGQFQSSGRINLGMVVALRKGGIVAPAILDADGLGLDGMMERLHDLIARARGGRLSRAEMAEATITITNLGDLGVDSVIGVIYPPQVALVGFGRIAERPWAHDGMVGVRPELIATLSADHRVSDGMRGARFLSRVDELLQEPERL